MTTASSAIPRGAMWVRVEHGDNYPTLTDLSASEPNADHSAFEFGLARILDGLELPVNSRRK